MFVLAATSKKGVSVFEFVLQRNLGEKEEEILQRERKSERHSSSPLFENCYFKSLFYG